MDKADIFEADGLFGVKNSTEKVLLPPLFKKIIPCHTEVYLQDCCSFSTYYIVSVNTAIGEKYALYDHKGRIILPPIYKNIIYAFGNYFIISPDWGSGVFEIGKGEIISTDYDGVLAEMSFFVVSKNNKKGVFAPSGRNICPIEYDDIKITEELILGKERGNIVIYEPSGAILFNNFYDEITDFVYGKWTDFCLVKRKGKWGCLNCAPWFCRVKEDISVLKEIVPCAYDFLAYTDKTIYSSQNEKDMFIKFFVKAYKGHLTYYLYDLYDRNDNPENRSIIANTAVITETLSVQAPF